MLGEPVAAAKRLESLNKVFGTSILISDEISRYLSKREFRTLELGTFAFFYADDQIEAGPISINELIGMRQTDGSQGSFSQDGSSAIAAVRARNWQEAIGRFEKLPPQGGLVSFFAMYVTWCGESLQERPSRWSGVISVSTDDKSQTLDRYLE
jgi:hypothetical protein